MKIKEAIYCLEILKNLTVMENEFSVKTGLKIIKNKNKLESELESYYELRNAAVLKYSNGTGEIDAKLNAKQYTECVNYINELEKEEINIEFNKISLSELDNIKLSLKTIDAISFMIEED